MNLSGSDDKQGSETLDTNYRCNISHDLVEQLQPLQKDAPSGLECLYLCDDSCADIDCRGQDIGRRRRETECAYRFRRLVGSGGSLKLVCIGALGWLSGKRKLDRNPARIGFIGGILAKTFFEYWSERSHQ